MKKILAALATTALLSAGAVAATQTSAQAEVTQKTAQKVTYKRNAPCVTKSEYRRIHKGMTHRRVKQITGSWGRVEFTYNGGGYRSVSRDYTPCKPFNKYGFVSISFDNMNDNWRRIPMSVDYKSAFWLHN